MSLGSYMYHNVSKSNVACWDTSLSADNITVRKWGLPYYIGIPWTHPLLLKYTYSYSTIHDGGHTTVKEATTKVVRVIEVTKE